MRVHEVYKKVIHQSLENGIYCKNVIKKTRERDQKKCLRTGFQLSEKFKKSRR